MSVVGRLRARCRRQLAKLRPCAPEIAIAIAATVIAWSFVDATLRHTHPFGLPLDDAYIYLTYAKQFGRAEPFTYYPGGGYSAGSTSVMWPMLLAPFWTLGARGHALVWVSYGLCAALYALTCIGCFRLARRITGSLGGLVAAACALGIPVFAWTSLAGMEVAFASACLVATILLLLGQPREGPPTKRLAVVLVATALSRPEAMLLVFAIVGVAILDRVRHKRWRAAAWWLAPIVPTLVWLLANKLLAGNWMPNTGVAKSHFYLPGFDWTYWWETVTKQSGRMVRTLFWNPTSPLIWPRVLAVLWLVGAVRVGVWAWRERRWLVASTLILSPWAVLMAVIASSGQWSFHNYRYVAPVFPLLAICAGVAVAPPNLHNRWVTRAWWAGAASFVVLFGRAGLPTLREQMALYAQNVDDLNHQVVRIGQYLATKLPESRVMFHDAGAVAYYGDTAVYDMLGLVTNHQAHVTNHGPGSRFEFLESLPPERRPTHFVYYPDWMGQPYFFDDVLMHTPLGRQFAKQRLIGGGDMQVIEARWDRTGTAERPLQHAPGWTIVDRLDIADVRSERAHRWDGALGRRVFGDPTAKWTVFHQETSSVHGLLLDGGRTIRGRRERFTVEIDPKRPMRLVMRSGGRQEYPWNDAIKSPVTVEILDGDRVLAGAALAAPDGSLVETSFELPPTRTLTIRSSAPYRVFHYFVLQPD